MPTPTYIISRVGDPIFAVFIGISAAVTRINREEKAKGRDTNETIEAGLRYVLLTRVAPLISMDWFVNCDYTRRIGLSRKSA
jgi:L-cystine uptake protein TcyP (sodium:dicarboxylate symporter family)